MPPFGRCIGHRSKLEAQQKPNICKFKPLGITLKQVGFSEALITRRHRAVLQPGDTHTVRVYGSLRCFPPTHIVPSMLTERNKRYLSSCLRFDPVFAVRMLPPELQQEPGFVVALSFAEWLMGLPHGWTSQEALGAAALERWKTGLPAFQQRTHRWKSASVFSGCGALDLALTPWVEPLLYCEKDPAGRQVLQARIADGSLPPGEIIGDVTDISARVARGK